MASKRKKHRRKYEGSKADVAEDKRMAKKRGMPMKQWEASPEDKAMDAAAMGSTPGPNEFTPGQEQSMRQRAAQSRMVPPDVENEPDEF
jgi:hypothetical protein